MKSGCLLKFEHEFLMFKGTSNHAVSGATMLAETINPQFVNDPAFRLKFLRAERYDPKLAVARVARYFDLKLKLFGESKLCKDITYEDLDREDIEGLKQGFLQILPQRDAAGRAILLVLPPFQKGSYRMSDEIYVSMGKISLIIRSEVEPCLHRVTF